MNLDHAWATLNGVPDPEVPVLSVVDLGIVRELAVNDDDVTVTLTPTYSGCPATEDENIPLFAWERVNPSTSMAAAAAVN